MRRAWTTGRGQRPRCIIIIVITIIITIINIITIIIIIIIIRWTGCWGASDISPRQTYGPPADPPPSPLLTNTLKTSKVSNDYTLCSLLSLVCCLLLVAYFLFAVSV